MAPWVIPLIMAVAGGAGAASSAVSSSKTNKANQAMTKEQIDAENAQQAREIALKESEMNPFRQQLAQAGSLASLDQMERGSYKPVQMQFSGPYAKYVPQMSGGYSYEKSPELVAAAGALKKDVLAGNRAPSVIPEYLRSNVQVDARTTNALPPANNSSAVLDLLAQLYPDQAAPAAPAGRRKYPWSDGSYRDYPEPMGPAAPGSTPTVKTPFRPKGATY